MAVDDAAGAHELATEAFADLSRRVGHETRWPEPTEADHRRGLLRIEHLLATDPDGCWVAEDDGELAGVAIAIDREDVWGLSLLVVRPGIQGRGVGGDLLDRALAYAEGGRRGAIILSSDDLPAMRSYRRAGFELRPAMVVSGRPPAMPGQEAVRAGSEADLPLCEELGRLLRGASHGPDLVALMQADCVLAIVEDRGFCLHLDGWPRLLGARDEAAARSLLLEALAHNPAGEEVFVPFLDVRQQWAIDAALDCGLRIEPGGPIFARGQLGPMTPYLPSGAYL